MRCLIALWAWKAIAARRKLTPVVWRIPSSRTSLRTTNVKNIPPRARLQLHCGTSPLEGSAELPSNTKAVEGGGPERLDGRSRSGSDPCSCSNILLLLDYKPRLRVMLPDAAIVASAVRFRGGATPSCVDLTQSSVSSVRPSFAWPRLGEGANVETETSAPCDPRAGLISVGESPHNASNGRRASRASLSLCGRCGMV